MASGIFLDLHIDNDWIGCTTPGAWVVPVGLSTMANGTTHIAHDCCSITELEHVLDQLQKDIEGIRQKARKAFASWDKPNA